MTDKNRYHHGNLKEALVEAAMDLVVEGGHGALSMRAVGKRAGVSGAAAYHHFKDKEALLAAILTRGYEQALVRMRAAGDAVSDPWQRLAILGRSYVRFAQDEPVLFRMMFGALKPDPKTHDTLDEAGACLFCYLLETVQELVDSGRTVDTEPVRLAMTIWSSVHGFAILVADGATDMEEFGMTTPDAMLGTLDALCSTIVRGIAKPER